MLKDLRRTGCCLYAWDSKTGDIIRMTLDSKKKETVIACGIKDRSAMVGIGSPTGSIYPGLNGYLQMTGLGGYMTVAQLDYSEIIRSHASIYRKVFSPLEIEYAGRPQQVVVAKLYDAASFKLSNWMCIGDYGVARPSKYDLSNGFVKTTIKSGLVSRDIPNGHRVIGFFEPGYALIHTRSTVYAYDLINNAKVSLLDTRQCSIWPRNLDMLDRFTVKIKGGTDRNHVGYWMMSNPTDYKPRP